MAIQDNKIVHFQELIEEMETMLEQGQRFAFSKDLKVVNAPDMASRLDLLKRSLPDNLAKAEALLREEEAHRKEVDKECQEALTKARQRADEMEAKAKEKLKEAQLSLDRSEEKNRHAQTEAETIAQKLTAQAQMEAQAIVQQAQVNAQQVIQAAQRQAQNILMQANMEAEQMKSREEVYLRAKVDAERIRADAEEKMQGLHGRVFGYLDELLSAAENYLGDLSADISREREELNNRR